MKKKAAKKNVGKPLTGDQVREVYSVRLPPALAQKAKERAGRLTRAVEAGLILYLREKSE